MVFTDEAVGALLALCSKVAVGQVATVQALVSTVVGGVEDRKGKTRKAASMHLVRGQPGRGVDGVVVG